MPLKTQFDDAPALNLTPMIDIVFLLIIFFMVVTTFARPDRSLEVDVPELADAGALSDRPAARVVNVHRDGRVELDRQEVTLDELTARLAGARRQYSDLEVDVRGDAQAVHQRIAEVVAACMKSGVNGVGISVRTTRQ